MSTFAPTNTSAKLEKENELRERANHYDEAALHQAVLKEITNRIEAFSDGVKAYQNHSRPPRHPEPRVLKQIGAARLLDYGLPESASTGHPVLLIPSLINKSYILDLTHERSLVRFMAEQGLRPLLIDWGHPGEIEKDYNLDSYITGPLQQFFDLAADLKDEKPSVLGYCMGGLLALALAQKNPDQIRGLSLLATPWDFHSGIGANLIYLETLRPGIDLLLTHLGHLPVDVLQALFASLDPSLTSAKFRHFSKMPPATASAQDFVALEDWLNDGVPLVAPVARECLFDWYLKNSPATGNWRVSGDQITPTSLTCPSLTLIPAHDHIVPPGSAQALADKLPQNTLLEIKAGHIGMITGSHAKTALYAPLTQWIKASANTKAH